MSAQGHALAMRECISDACKQGRAACPTPMRCSGAGPLVDESLDLWRLHRLQDVEALEARWTQPRPTVYLAPGVVDRGEPDEFLKQEGALHACSRWILGALFLWVAVFVAAGYIAAALRWL